jgi:hypothetical protein
MPERHQIGNEHVRQSASFAVVTLAGRQPDATAAFGAAVRRDEEPMKPGEGLPPTMDR